MGQGIKDLTGKISAGQIIVQPFIPSYSLLESISIDFATYHRINNAKLKFELLDRDSKVLYSETIGMSLLKDNEFHVFKIGIPLDNDKLHYIMLSSNGNDFNAVTAKYCIYEDPITDSNVKLYLFEHFIDGQLSCIMTYSDIVDTVLKCAEAVNENIDNFCNGLKKKFQPIFSKMF
jgi:hypothetical protein